MQPDDQTTPDGQDDQTKIRRRVTVREAARLLDTTVEGVRARIKRGSLDSMRVSGTVYVLLDPDRAGQDGGTRPDRQDDRTQPDHALRRLVDEQRDQIEFLRRELEGRAGELAEMRRIVAALTQRIPELPSAAPSQEPRDGHESGSKIRPDVDLQDENGDRETSVRRSWWRRWFGA